MVPDFTPFRTTLKCGDEQGLEPASSLHGLLGELFLGILISALYTQTDMCLLAIAKSLPDFGVKFTSIYATHNVLWRPDGCEF
jgi:hypothetical protein